MCYRKGGAPAAGWEGSGTRGVPVSWVPSVGRLCSAYVLPGLRSQMPAVTVGSLDSVTEGNGLMVHATEIAEGGVKHTHAHTHTCAQTPTCTHAHTHLHAHTPTHTHTPLRAHTPLHAHTHTHTCARTHTHTYMDTRTPLHAHTHTHTYTHARTHTIWSPAKLYLYFKGVVSISVISL